MGDRFAQIEHGFVGEVRNPVKPFSGRNREAGAGGDDEAFCGQRFSVELETMRSDEVTGAEHEVHAHGSESVRTVLRFDGSHDFGNRSVTLARSMSGAHPPIADRLAERRVFATLAE